MPETKIETKTKLVKWLTIGFLIFLAILLIAGGIIVWKFSPLVTVNEEDGHIAILNGMLELKGEDGTLRIGNMITKENSLTLEGNLPVTPQMKSVELIFSEGKIETRSIASGALTWNCKYHGDEVKDYVSQKKSVTIIHFETADGVQCKIGIPKKLSIKITGTNGTIEIKKPNGPIKIELENGKVGFTADETLAYKYDIWVANGASDEFESSLDPKPISISIKVENGKIEKEE